VLQLHLELLEVQLLLKFLTIQMYHLYLQPLTLLKYLMNHLILMYQRLLVLQLLLVLLEVQLHLKYQKILNFLKFHLIQMYLNFLIYHSTH
jgi:hypothetical protein